MDIGWGRRGWVWNVSYWDDTKCQLLRWYEIVSCWDDTKLLTHSPAVLFITYFIYIDAVVTKSCKSWGLHVESDILDMFFRIPTPAILTIISKWWAVIPAGISHLRQGKAIVQRGDNQRENNERSEGCTFTHFLCTRQIEFSKLYFYRQERIVC